MRLGRLAIPITVVGVVLMLAGAGTAPAAARVQEPGVTAPSAAAMNLPAVATDAPETSAASGPVPESVVRVNPSPASTSAKTSAPDRKTDPPDSPTAASGEEASPAGAVAGRGTVNALEPPEGPAVQESTAHTIRDIAVDDGGEGSAAGKQEEPGAGGQPVFQAAVNSYDETLKPGSNLISFSLIPDDNADVGQDQRDIGPAEESPGSGRPVAEVPAPVESAASLTPVDLNINLLKLEASRSPRESDHAITDTGSPFSHIVTGGDTSNFKSNGTPGEPQLAPKASITCDPPSSPKATATFRAKVSVTNHTLSEDAELFLKVTFSREIYEWSRERQSARFSLKPGQTHEEIGEFRSLLPGEGYAMDCELRRRLTGPLFIGWPDESVATDGKTFSVGDFQSNDTTYSVAEMTECSASASNLQVGDTVRLQVKAKTKDADSTLIAASFIQISRDAKLVDSYPSVGSIFPLKKNERREKEREVRTLTNRNLIDRTRLLYYSFTPSEPGLYTAYCFLHTGAVRGFTAKTRDENLTLNDYYKVLSLFLPGGGPAIDFWSEILSGYFSHLESVKSVHFCVGDPEDCEFYSTSDDESSGEPDLEVESLTVSKSAMEPGETFTLTASVLNSGSSASSETPLHYYRSTNSTFSTSDAEDLVNRVIALDPSDTARVSHPLTAPSNPGPYYYRTCVTPVMGESNANNNCSSGVPVTVEATQQGSPDLVVEKESVTKSETQPGGRFTLKATVRNIGDGRAASAILRYYRSTDSSISTSSDTEVASDTVNSLWPSETDDESGGVSAPVVPGEYYYGACIAPVPGESDTGNNCSSGRKVTVAQATHTSPDLVVDSPSVSQNEVDAGGGFTLSTRVRNSGDGSSPVTILRYYRSADSAITIGDTEVETDKVQYLDPLETGEESERLTAPEDAGDYYYGACVDSVSGESDTANNCSSGVRVTVEQTTPEPDLVTESPSASDSELETGESFTLSATVRNNGDGSSSATTLRYYLSTDSTITTGDTEVGTDSVDQLDVTDTSSESISLTAPSIPGTYYYGACVDSVSDESDTTNNCSSGVTVTVTVPGQNAPDLVVHSPSVYDKVFGPGERFQMSFWVRNQGDVGTTTNATLRYYRSTDSTISTADTELTIRSGVIGVGPIDASGSRLVTVYLNAHSSGTYYYGACVGTVLVESNTQNNCSAVFRVALTAPDLVVHPPSLSNASAEPGDSFTLSATVNNQGDSEAAATMLRYYRSDDSTISTSDTQVGTDSVSSLNPNRSSRESIDLTAPSDPGTNYYGACVDSVEGELDTENNCSSSVAVTVTGGSAAAPDLVVQPPSVSDSNVEPGGSFTLSANVGNQGVGAAGSTTLRFYRSTDSTISTSDTQVGTDSVSSLDPNETSSQSISVTAPSSLRTYYYGACVDAVVDESSTENNCSSSVAVTVATATSGSPDLRTRASVSEDLLRTGESFTLRAIVSNQGNRGGGTSASTALRYYSSTDSAISSADTELGTEVVRALGLGQNSSLSIDLTAPASRGTYYYGACVDTVPGESNTQNDCSAGVEVTVEDTFPDLVVESPSVSNPDLETGESFTLSVTVRNQGDGTASSSTLRYYRSTDSTISSSDAFLDTDGVSSLGSGETSAESDSMTAPTSVGTYYYGACVDSVSGESNTGNNCSVGVQVTVTGESRSNPDLVVQSPSVSDSSVKPGDSLTLSATVRNQGDGSSVATTLRYYRSSNSEIRTSDTLEGTDPVGVLAASGTSSQSIDLTAPTSPDTYYYGACVVSVSGESNTGNNCSTGVQVIVEEVYPDLVVDTPTVDESSLETGEGFRLSTMVRNQGDGRPRSNTTLRYYRSTDSSISSSDTEVGTDDVGRVRPSETSSESIDLAAPATAGTYYYGACVDAVQQESNTQNNCSGSVQVTVTQGNPDLVVESPSVSVSNPAAGTVFRLSGTVRNQGDRTSAATTIRYYRSTDSSISSSDTEVATDTVRSLEPSQTSNEFFDLTAPANAGTYYYGACVDSVTGESDTGNNCSSSVTVTVTGTTTTAPDLVVESPSVDDKHLDPDDNLNDDFRLTVTVRNQGDGASPEATLRYYRSTDSTITASDTQVDTDIANALTASGTDEINTPIDSPTSTGTYYYGACVDSVSRESDTQNNCSTGVEVIVSKVGEGNPDLVVQSPTVSRDNLEAGTSLTVGATVRNQGTGRTPETDLRYYRSTDSTITTSDTEVDSDGIDTLGPTETTTESDGVLAPGDAGTYYFGACVESVARESNTQNNCSGGVAVTVTGSAVVGPDLVVESPSVDYSRVAPDEIFRIDVTVRNQGNVESDRTTLRYYQSTDSTISTSDTEVDTDSVTTLDPSESDGEYDSLRTPEIEGTYYYGACVDSVTDETDTTNNCSAGVKVTVIGPDLVVEPPSVDDSSLDPGQSFTLRVTVRNQGGEGERSNSTTLRYYRSTDSSISSGDTQVGTDRVRSLSADDTSDESITLNAPTTPGTYYYGACVDAESDESVTNNNCSTAVTITVQ